MSYGAFVDAETSDAAEVDTSEEVAALVRGRAASAGDGDGAGTERTPTVIVRRVPPNGTVIGEMEVYGNESVRIVQANRTGN